MCSVNPDLDDDDTNSLMLSEEPLKYNFSLFLVYKSHFYVFQWLLLKCLCYFYCFRSQELCRKCKESSSVVILQSKFPYCK